MFVYCKLLSTLTRRGLEVEEHWSSYHGNTFKDNNNLSERSSPGN